MGDWFDEGPSGGQPVDVPALLDSQGGMVVQELVSLGALVSLGLTRDGGALVITVTVDGRWKRGYFRHSEEIADWMAEALPAVKLAVEALAASAERSTRSRRSRGL